MADDDDLPNMVDVSSSSDEESESESEDNTDDEDILHGNIGPPVGCDPPPKQWFRMRGKFIAKEFEVSGQEYPSLFCGVVGCYDQTTKRHEVLYEDESTITYAPDEVREMITTFESWYAKVSCGGRAMTRKQAAPYIVKAHRKKQVQDEAERGTVDLTAAAASSVTEPEKSKEHASHAAIQMAVKIKKMKVKELREECTKAMLDESGLKKALQERLMEHYKCKDILHETTKGKHSCVWTRKTFDATPTPFTDQDFNEKSLAQYLPSFPETMPNPGECYDFFMIEEMWRLGLECTNIYPRIIRSQMQPPPWHRAKLPWPPVWTETPWTFTMQQFKANTAALYMLGVKHKGKDNLRSMFGSDEFYQEDWLKEITTRIQLESFLRQLHFEDSTDPFGKKYEYSTNYRPNFVPKMGLMMEHYRRRCCLFIPENNFSYDEATAKYTGRMTHLKHLQSKYKPYDGVRIYSLNGSKTGYTNNFRVDLRDKTSVEAMFQSVLKPFEGKGYTCWGDNAFTTVNMLRECKKRGINFAGTTRTTYGFPRSLVDENLEAGEWKWLMSKEGFLAAFWADVGYVKLMSNFHSPEQGQVLRRVSGQADKQERGAPTVGVEYNSFMGGTDLVDFIRGLYTTHRRGKKWWRCLYYWLLDSAMYNAFVLYRWCWAFKNEGGKCTMKYKNFVLHVCKHLLAPATTTPTATFSTNNTPTACCITTPSSDSSSATLRYRARVTVNRNCKRKINMNPYKGPGGEVRRPLKRAVCVGSDLVKQVKERNKGSGVMRHDCAYCAGAWSKRKRVRTTWMCPLCSTPLCVGCNNKYHKWVLMIE